jgi:ribosome-associated heat shock protein Hsp15
VAVMAEGTPDGLVAPASAISVDDAARYGIVETGTVRLDRWLWAARLFKTRSQAANACLAGHVKHAGDALKAAKAVRVGDRIEATTAAGRRIVVVRRLSERRGPPAIARALYDDFSPPPPPREEAFAVRDRGAGRPEKRQRRLLVRLRGR